MTADRTVLITGASRGIGEATARHMAVNGWNVVLAARSLLDIERIGDDISESGGQVLVQACDVADYDSVSSLVLEAKEKFGAINLIVNNAGVINPIARLADSNPEDWSSVVDINLKGVYNVTRAVLPLMVEAGDGTIINISSGAANAPLEGWSHYCATKAAVKMLTAMVHKEYGDHGIRSVGLSPGTVATKMQVDIKASGINPVSKLDPGAHIPPEWVAKAIQWLAEGGADNYLGADFSLKTDEGRAAVGLPPV
ncbi:MAG: SDR family oxidoreductase [Pseudomonadota bacterium]